MAITATQRQDGAGAYRAEIKVHGVTIDIAVYPDVQLTNGLPQIVGFVYDVDQHDAQGNLHDESDPCACLDSDIV